MHFIFFAAPIANAIRRTRRRYVRRTYAPFLRRLSLTRYGARDDTTFLNEPIIIASQNRISCF